MTKDILIVDDEADICNLVCGILEDEGFETRTASNSNQAFEKISEKRPDLIIQDIWLQGSEKDGIEILEQVKKDYPYLPVVMISGHGTIETAVSAIKKGAYDFIEKPFKSDRLLLMIARALENASLKRENDAFKQKSKPLSDLIGKSGAIDSVRQVLERVSPTNSRVLITGKAGTGKEIAARYIHATSSRSEEPFMTLNCAILRPERLEIELFGSEEEGGTRSGILEQANGGTLFLDEVSDMPLETQGKIVNVLQNQTFQRLGSDRQTHIDVRIIASTNKDLETMIDNGDFRQDLYYRLNVVPVIMPSLKDRSDDIPDLLKYFSDIISDITGMPQKGFTQGAVSILQSYDWPGNVRQLRNVVEWVMIMHGGHEGKSFDVSHLPPEINHMDSAQSSSDSLESGAGSVESYDFMALSLRDAREVFEKAYLGQQIKRFGGNVSKTAQFIGMERSALHRKLKSLEIIGSEKSDQSDKQVEDKKVASM